MKKFEYVPRTQASWVEYLYHGEVVVTNGVTEIEDNDTLTEMWLLNHSFARVDEPVEAVADEVPVEDVPVQATRTRSTRKATAKK